MTKQELLNDSIDNLARKDDLKQSIWFAAFVLMVMVTLVSLCGLVQTKSENANLKFQVDQRDEIISRLTADVNELTYDNLNLLNNGKY